MYCYCCCIRFGEGLALPEQQWLVYEINKYLTEERGEDVRMDLEPPGDAPKVGHPGNIQLIRLKTT